MQYRESSRSLPSETYRRRPPTRYPELWVVIVALLFVVCDSSMTAAAEETNGRRVPPTEFDNPFTTGGCLYQRKEGWRKKRVCGSEDSSEIKESGGHYCESSNPLDYMEIRIHGEDWVAALFETWALQILLSEVLQVPTSVETSVAGNAVNFYDSRSRIQPGSSDNFICLESGAVGDCSLVQGSGEGDEDYQSCCHFIPEVWHVDTGIYDHILDDPFMEATLPMGTIGEEHWYIPKFTAERDPSLTSYIGLAKSRTKLADRFLRPTTWREYCTEVANCNDDDNTADGTVIAKRPPEPDEEDGDRFFVPGLYQGHFRATVDNNCTLSPDTCTGHFFDYPCGWPSYAIQQAYHLGIAVMGNGPEASGGYTHGQLVDALLASNATKSDILLMWWSPEMNAQQFIGTDMELTQIVLPPVTYECTENRVSEVDRCSADPQKRRGSSLGACGLAPNGLKKLISVGVRNDDPQGVERSKATQSPALDVLKSFQMSGRQISDLFVKWNRNVRQNEIANNGAREAVCEWVIENFHDLKEFIPRSFPRIVMPGTKENRGRRSQESASQILASVAIVVVLMATLLTYVQRGRPVMVYAQLEFLTLLLVGLTLVSVGSLLMSFPASDFLCSASIWLTNLGYTLELVPLIVKMAAIHRIMRAAKRLRHIVVNRRTLAGAVVGLCFVMLTFLICMTVLDKARLLPEFTLSEVENEEGETEVYRTFNCQSKSNRWLIITLSWHLALLLISTVQAFLTRNVRIELNDSRTLTVLIYSQFVFVWLRISTLFLGDAVVESSLNLARSMIYSLDCIATVSLYFVPKFISEDSDFEESEQMVGSSTVKNLRMLAALATAQHERQMKRMSKESPDVAFPREDDEEEKPVGLTPVGLTPVGLTPVVGFAPEQFNSRSSIRLFLPPENFQAHLRNVDPGTYMLPVRSTSSTNTSHDATVESLTPEVRPDE